MQYGSDQYLKEIRRLTTLGPDKKDKYYKATCEHAEAMAVHIYGTLPEKILKRARPREDDDIRQYRLDSYEPTTMATAGKALTIMSTVWSPTLWSLKPKETDQGKEFFDYITKNYPKFKSLFVYLETVLSKKQVADPNSWVVVVPNNPNAAPTERLQPILRIFGSRRRYFDDGETLIFLQKVIVKGREVKYLWVDRNVVMELSVLVLADRIETTIISSYIHGFNEMPAWQLEGEFFADDTEDDNELAYYKSFFHPAIPFWNKAINGESDLDAAYIGHLHPQRVEIATTCDYEDSENRAIRCEQGFIYDRVNGGPKKKCPSCNGTGKRSVKGPFGVVYVNREKLDPDGPGASEAVSYVSVPTEATKMLGERVENQLIKGLHALNMEVVDRIGENQSGIAKEKDRTELKQFLQRVANVDFDVHVAKALSFFARYMYSVEGKAETDVIPEVHKPSDFDIEGLNELIEQLTKATTTGMNSSYLKTKQVTIQNKEFAAYPEQKKKLNGIIELDPLPGAKPEDISAMLMDGATSKKRAIIHSNLDEFINRAISEDPKFFENDRKKQYEVLTKYAEEIEEENKIELETNAIEDGSGDPGNPAGQPAGGGNDAVRKKGGNDSNGDLE